MGLFSSRRKTYVSSVAYPLGEDDGPQKQQFMKTTVLNAVLSQDDVARSITSGYLNGQGIALRNAFRYAKDNYTGGLPFSQGRYIDRPDLTELTAILGQIHPIGEVEYNTVMIGTAEFEWWAERYLADNYGYDRRAMEFDRPPAGVERTANVAYDLEPDGRVKILLMNNDGSTQVITIQPSGYEQMGVYVHAAYTLEQIFKTAASTVVRDKTPGETNSNSITVVVVERTEEIQTTTTRVTTTVDTPEPGKTTVVTEAETVVVSRMKYFLYRLGKGTYPQLDNLIGSAALAVPYFPAVPIRVDNRSVVGEANKGTAQYKTSKKYLRKIGLDLDKIVKDIESNPQIGDIDFAFIVQGVQLKVQSQEGKRYLFRFFQHLRNISASDTTQAAHQEWGSLFDAIAAALENQRARTNPPKVNRLEIYNPKDRKNNYDILLQWNYIDTTLQSGQVFPNAKPGDVTIGMQGGQVVRSFRWMNLEMESSILMARRQIDANTYEQLEISGLYYENFIYQGKSVSISAWDAFNDEEEEGFIIPLSQQILNDMPLKEVTDLGYHCSHLVFNCYKIVKQKWYQRGIFKVILFIIAVIVTIFFPPAGGALYGAIGALGAAVGLSGLALAIFVAVVYVLAVMIIANLIIKAGTKIFGEWFAVIATVIAFLTNNWQQILQNGIRSLVLTAQNIINLTSAVLQAYGQYAAMKVKDITAELEGLEDQWKKKFNELEDMMEKMLGNNSHIIDIQGITEATRIRFFEKRESFLGRTLLTGSDIAAITNGQITNFVESSLRIPDQA
jgi:hypothetical protein